MSTNSQYTDALIGYIARKRQVQGLVKWDGTLKGDAFKSMNARYSALMRDSDERPGAKTLLATIWSAISAEDYGLALKLIADLDDDKRIGKIPDAVLKSARETVLATQAAL